MSPSTRRSFLTLASGGAVALSAGTEFFDNRQLPGHSSSGNTVLQDREFLNVMAIAAHPGDAFFSMGAAVAIATHFGGQGSFLSLSLGEKGSASIPVEQYGASQREAAQKAAALIGAKALFLQYPDGQIPVNDEAKFAVCDLIRQYKPSMVITHRKGRLAQGPSCLSRHRRRRNLLRRTSCFRSHGSSPWGQQAVLCRQLGRRSWLRRRHISGYNSCLRSLVECV